MRINARLDPQTQSQLQYIIDHTESNISQAIKQAIHHYFTLLSEHRHAAKIMEASGFVGCAEGPKQLSTTYKKQLTDSLGVKHDHG